MKVDYASAYLDSEEEKRCSGYLIPYQAVYQYKFAHELTDRSAGDQVDHLALLMHKIQVANTDSAEGIFWGKKLTAAEKHQRIWAPLKYSEHNLAPSRQTKAQKAVQLSQQDMTGHAPQ